MAAMGDSPKRDPLPDDPDEIWPEEEGGIHMPMAVAMQFLWKVRGIEPHANIPLEELVTPESLDSWNDTRELHAMLEGAGVASQVRYLSPSWAMILLPLDVGEGGLLREPELIRAYAIYVKYIDELAGWRVHFVGPPDIDVSELP